MCKTLVGMLEAVAVVAWLVVPLGATQEHVGTSPIVDGSAIVTPPAQAQARPAEARQAKRHQATQLTGKDVALHTTRAPQPAQNQPLDRAGVNSGVRKSVNGAGFRVALQDARFGEAMASGTPCPKWICGSNSPIVDGAEIVAQPAQARQAKRHQAPQLTAKDVALDTTRAHEPVQNQPLDRAGVDSGVRKAVNGAGFRVALQDARFGEAMASGAAPCPKWLCGSNSPIVDGAEIVAQPAQARQAKRHQVPQLTGKDVALDTKPVPEPVQKQAVDRAGVNSGARKAVTGAGFRVALQDARFGEAMASGAAPCPRWICGSNSPVVDGAEIVAQPAQAHQAKRHQAPQLTGKDVALDNARAQQPVQNLPLDRAGVNSGVRKAVNGAGFRVALRDARFGEAFGQNLNSPIVDGAATTTRAFHELNMAGEPNAAGFVALGARKGHTAYVLDVKGATVTAHPRTGATRPLTGAALVGLVFDLRGAGGDRYALRVAAADTTTYWAGAPEVVPTYSLTYTTAMQPDPQPLCTAGVNEAILFTGDRYDAVRKTVTATGDATRGWINIACARTALAKLYLVRHTDASQAVGTTLAERQAMLKMFTADVCGDGTSFTIHGQPLLWADAKGITMFAATAASLEAVWNENGAVCLDQPRRPELAAAITARCGPLPRCTSGTRGHVLSANPQ